jgi:hypothetical protein
MFPGSQEEYSTIFLEFEVCKLTTFSKKKNVQKNKYSFTDDYFFEVKKRIFIVRQTKLNFSTKNAEIVK